MLAKATNHIRNKSPSFTFANGIERRHRVTATLRLALSPFAVLFFGLLSLSFHQVGTSSRKVALDKDLIIVIFFIDKMVKVTLLAGQQMRRCRVWR